MRNGGKRKSRSHGTATGAKSEESGLFRQILAWIFPRKEEDDFDGGYQPMTVMGIPLVVDRKVSVDEGSKSIFLQIKRVLGCELVGMKCRELKAAISSRLAGELQQLQIDADHALAYVIAFCVTCKQVALKAPALAQHHPDYYDEITVIPA